MKKVFYLLVLIVLIGCSNKETFLENDFKENSFTLEDGSKIQIQVNQINKYEFSIEVKSSDTNSFIGFAKSSPMESTKLQPYIGDLGLYKGHFKVNFDPQPGQYLNIYKIGVAKHNENPGYFIERIKYVYFRSETDFCIPEK
ncbi:MAG: hypothetical protein WDK96_01280 [Candidatus Paceibacterota bacterium]|jgi:hypothetical protein